MPNFDLTKGPAGYPSTGEGILAIENTIDFSSCTGIAAADTVNLLEIPAGCVVYAITAVVKTACAAAMTMTIGDATDVDGWTSAISLNGTAGTMSLSNGAYFATDAAAIGGKVYSAATTITGTIGGTAGASGKIKIKALVSR